MKIAFLNIYQGAVNRGLETYVTELSKRLGKIHIVKVFGGHETPKKRWPVLWRFYLDPHSFSVALYTIKLLPNIWKEKYNAVFALNGGWQPALIRLITWLYGGKMIIPGQSGIGWDDRNNLWSFPDSFVALSTFAAKWANKANPFVNVDIIPNGVDLDKFKPVGKKYTTSLKDPIIVCQGALELSKRLDLTIRAVGKLKRVSLILVGGGSLKEELFTLGKKTLGDNFEIVEVPHNKMPDIYRLGKVFTLPSWSSEAFGIAYVEAMATNLPVVATDDPVRREIVGNAGIFVEPENTKDYSQALRDAINKNWKDLPRKQAEKFSWDNIGEKYETLFQKLTK